MGVKVVPGFTGSPIWPFIYSFPPNPADLIEKGYAFFAEMWNPILDVFDEVGVKFALEVHPTEIAFDIASAERAVDALEGRKAFGFNYDPSHFGYQGVDYVAFIPKLRRAHLPRPHEGRVLVVDKPTEAGVFGGHLNFGDRRRFWDFRSLGRGRINFEEIIRALERDQLPGPALGGVGRRRHGPRVRRHGSLRLCQAYGFRAVSDCLRRRVRAEKKS